MSPMDNDAAYIIAFLGGLTKMKLAAERNEGVCLTPDETQACLESFKLLRQGLK